MTVGSAFAEVQVPLLAERPLVEMLSVNAAVRREDTSLIGANTTWSIGAVWNINDESARPVAQRDFVLGTSPLAVLAADHDNPPIGVS